MKVYTKRSFGTLENGNQSMDWEAGSSICQRPGEYEITLRLQGWTIVVVQTNKKSRLQISFFKFLMFKSQDAEWVVNDFYFPKFIHLSELEFWVMEINGVN